MEALQTLGLTKGEVLMPRRDYAGVVALVRFVQKLEEHYRSGMTISEAFDQDFGEDEDYVRLFREDRTFKNNRGRGVTQASLPKVIKTSAPRQPRKQRKGRRGAPAGGKPKKVDLRRRRGIAKPIVQQPRHQSGSLRRFWTPELATIVKPWAKGAFCQDHEQHTCKSRLFYLTIMCCVAEWQRTEGANRGTGPRVSLRAILSTSKSLQREAAYAPVSTQQVYTWLCLNGWCHVAYYLDEIAHDSVYNKLRQKGLLREARRDGMLRLTDDGLTQANLLGGMLFLKWCK